MRRSSRPVVEKKQRNTGILPWLVQAAASNDNLRWLRVPDFNLRRIRSARSRVPPRATVHTTWSPKLRPEHCRPRHGKGAALFCFCSERITGRLFGVSKIETLEAVKRSNALPHALSRYSNTVLAPGKIDEGELPEEARIGSAS